jgi:regulatory protein
MEGKITALREQKRKKDRVNVYLDGEYAFSLGARLAAELQEGNFLSAAALHRLQRRDSFARAYRKSLDYLAYRPRSQRELSDHLRGKRVPARIIEEVLGGLAQEGLVDDLAFAQYWVENRERFRPRSRAMLRYELRRKGLGEEVISEALAAVDEEESVRRAAHQRAPRYVHLDERSFRQKMSEFLRRRGFTYHLIREVVDSLLQQRGGD